MGCIMTEQDMSEIAKAMMNQWVAFILFRRNQRTTTTVMFDTMDNRTGKRKCLYQSMPIIEVI